MSQIQGRKFCKQCGGKTLHVKSRFSFILGLFLTVLTLGLFLPFWIAFWFMDGFNPWRCQTCGSGTMV